MAEAAGYDLPVIGRSWLKHLVSEISRHGIYEISSL